jgi:uncharacterized damage-inducible protein DinB
MTEQDKIRAAQRDDGSMSTDDLIVAYEYGIEELWTAVAGMATNELRARPVPGKWSTLEVVCHIADCEQFFADRMKRTIAMDRPLLLGAEGFRYPDSLAYQHHDLDEELRLVEITRRQMARVLRLAARDAWDRAAVHSETGLVTLRQLVLHAVRHVRHHLKFIEEKRRALQSESSNE